MLKYKDTYFIGKPKDSEGKVTSNKDDNYIRCRKNVQIYRFNVDTLAIQFNTKIYTSNRMKELSDVNMSPIPFQIGDNEQVYLFPESDLSKVADIVKAKKRIKRDLTDEQRKEIGERLNNARKNDS